MLRRHQASASCDEDVAALVVHFTPKDVFKHHRLTGDIIAIVDLYDMNLLSDTNNGWTVFHPAPGIWCLMNATLAWAVYPFTGFNTS